MKAYQSGCKSSFQLPVGNLCVGAMDPIDHHIPRVGVGGEIPAPAQDHFILWCNRGGESGAGGGLKISEAIFPEVPLLGRPVALLGAMHLLH